MSIELVKKYQTAVDEMFSAESKRNLVTNRDYNWDGAKTIYIYKITTTELNDYDRAGEKSAEQWSRYGEIKNLDAIIETHTITQDKSFTFVLDKMDVDETGRTLDAASSLARQEREVVIPAYDQYVYKVICEGAGTTVTNDLTAETIYDAILDASAELDNNMVPETDRCILIPPNYYKFLKKSSEIAMETNVGQDMRLKGVVGIIDGMLVVKVPANRLPENTGFVLVHKSACVAPVKLQEFETHENPPGINGYLIEGRMYFDAFVLDNKKKGIYLHKTQ